MKKLFCLLMALLCLASAALSEEETEQKAERVIDPTKPMIALTFDAVSYTHLQRQRAGTRVRIGAQGHIQPGNSQHTRTSLISTINYHSTFCAICKTKCAEPRRDFRGF